MGRWLWLGVVVVLAGCPQDITRTPVPQEDVLVVGRLAAVSERTQEPGVFDLTVRLTVPESLKGVMRKEGRPIPEAEKEMTAKVKVDSNSVCIVDGEAGELSRLRVGQEVVVVPVPGSCAMLGDKELLADAAEVYEFRSYQVRALPKSLEAIPTWVTERNDPAKVNSSGKEVSPIPVAGGRVLYFSAGLLLPLLEGQPLRGPIRPGMSEGGKLLPWAAQGGVRPYRTAFLNGSWTPPQPLLFPELAPEASVRVTWVAQDESALLAELRLPEKPPALVQSTRDAKGQWGPLVPVPEAQGKPSGDGQRFGRALQALVWTVYEYDSSDLYLKMAEGPGQPLEPRINTRNTEWAPRVGPNTTLYFCRGDRQLLFANKTIQEVRLPGTLRVPLSEAAPSPDGSLLFFRIPRFTAGEPDWDIAVAQRRGEGWGPAVRLDDFRPQ